MPFNRWLGVAMVVCLTVGIGVNIGLWLRPAAQQIVLSSVSYEPNITTCEWNQSFTGQICSAPVKEVRYQTTIPLNTCPTLWTHEMILLLDSITAQTGIRFSCLVPQK